MFLCMDVNLFSFGVFPYLWSLFADSTFDSFILSVSFHSFYDFYLRLYNYSRGKESLRRPLELDGEVLDSKVGLRRFPDS